MSNSEKSEAYLENGEKRVLKMLAVMEQSPDSNHDPVQDFLSTGRTGRRNALPDILGQNANTSTAELPECLQKLSASDGDNISLTRVSSSTEETPHPFSIKLTPGDSSTSDITSNTDLTATTPTTPQAPTSTGNSSKESKPEETPQDASS